MSQNQQEVSQDGETSSRINQSRGIRKTMPQPEKVASEYSRHTSTTYKLVFIPRHELFPVLRSHCSHRGASHKTPC